MTRGDSESSEGGGKGQDEMALPSYFYDSPEPIESRWTSWLVPLFVTANVIVFFVAMFVNNCPANTDAGSTACIARFLHRFSFQPLRENPLLGPSASALEKVGAVKWEEVAHEHQGWRLISSVWLHAGIIHLLVDILCLIFVGIRLEQQFGFGELLFYCY
ncbi:hypothetical protein AXF42_Ash020238 [Apostasia shenzhenica]|uniref:RHOMBOID-like protein n=1 Tax=Apostasia shenzhenica TaxID=1088818 RepID=A0A2H9ZX06_9ASPA|nr:hypothetical protein AXF42_Ash020238 [Apostasia shenzhenica]